MRLYFDILFLNINVVLKQLLLHYYKILSLVMKQIITIQYKLFTCYILYFNLREK